MLIRSRKFDIRIWVVVNDDGNVFVYLPGYIRTSSEAFSLDRYLFDVAAAAATAAAVHTCLDAVCLPCVSFSEYKYIHLTNYCQQKHAPSFEKFEAGNTLSFVDFEQFLAESVSKGENALQDVIMPQIKRFICDTFLALQGSGGRCDGCGLVLTLLFPSRIAQFAACISVACFAGCLSFSAHGFAENGFGKKPRVTQQHRFELLGYDFMVDDDLKVWYVKTVLQSLGCSAVPSWQTNPRLLAMVCLCAAGLSKLTRTRRCRTKTTGTKPWWTPCWIRRFP